MDAQWLFEEKHALLKNELSDKLQKKVTLELEISKQFEQLKRLEITMEKTSSHCTLREQRTAHYPWKHLIRPANGSLKVHNISHHQGTTIFFLFLADNAQEFAAFEWRQDSSLKAFSS
jgi:hypothetical protein